MPRLMYTCSMYLVMYAYACLTTVHYAYFSFPIDIVYQLRSKDII